MRTTWGLRQRIRARINRQRDPVRVAYAVLLGGVLLGMHVVLPGLDFVITMALAAICGRITFLLFRMSDRAEYNWDKENNNGT